MSAYLQLLKPDFCALVCTTTPIAIGAMGAVHNVHIRIGDELSVCSVNDEGRGRFTYPSLTSTLIPDPLAYLVVGLGQTVFNQFPLVVGKLVPARPCTSRQAV